MSAIIIILLLLAILLIVFTLQNSVEITIQLFFWEIANAPLVLVLMSCFVIGYLISSFYFYPRVWKLKGENRKLVKLNEKLNEEANHNRQNADEEEDHPEGIAFEQDKGKYNLFND